MAVMVLKAAMLAMTAAVVVSAMARTVTVCMGGGRRGGLFPPHTLSGADLTAPLHILSGTFCHGNRQMTEKVQALSLVVVVVGFVVMDHGWKPVWLLVRGGRLGSLRNRYR
jgi:hypothetical protein